MITGMSLSTRAIEMNAAVGLLFWWEFSKKNGRDGIGVCSPWAPYLTSYSSTYQPLSLDIIFRKADVKKKGHTRGWELLLHHDLDKKITTGYYKGTETTNPSVIVDALKSCVEDIHHPLLLCLLIIQSTLDGSIGYNAEQRHRDARDWLRRLEHAIIAKEDEPGYERSEYVGYLDTDILSLDLGKCHAMTLWTAPKVYARNLDEFETLLERIRSWLVDDATHLRFSSRIKFLKSRLENMDDYAEATRSRLEIQRKAVSAC